MSIKEHLDAVVAGFKTVMTGNDVAAFGGRFTPDSLTRFMAKAPAARIGVIGVIRTEPLATGQYIAQVQYFGALVNKNLVAADRDAEGILLAEKIMTLLHGTRFGSPGLQSDPCFDIRIDNQYSDEDHGKAISLYGVGWTSGVLCGEVTDPIIDPWDVGFNEFDSLTEGDSRILEDDVVIDTEDTFDGQ